MDNNHKDLLLEPSSEEQEEKPKEGKSEDSSEQDTSSKEAKSKSEEDDIPSSVKVELRSKHISAGTLKQSAVLIEQLNLVSDSSSVAVKLSIQHFRAWSLEDLERCEAELVFDQVTIQELSRTLEEKRLLVISGDPESGKGSMALLTASFLNRRNSLTGVLSCQGLSAAVSVDLDEISGTEPFGRRVVLLEDALAGENPDLTRFLRTLDSVGCGPLLERLKRNRSAIILTVASHTIEAFKARLESQGVFQIIGPPSLELRHLALKRFAERLRLGEASRESLRAYLDVNGEEIALKLGTVPKIARFVHEYLLDVAEGNLTLDQAMDRMDDLSQWLMNDLAGDLDAQAVVLALVLCSAAPPTIGVPWFAFDRLRRRILDRLRKELRIPDDDPLSPKDLSRGPLILDRARARVVDMPAPLPDLVRFKDDRYPQWLWQALLGSCRSLTTILLPLLQELTEEPDAFLQASAARALGRLGQIDPIHQAAPCLQTWTRGEDSPDDRAAAFLQGAVASTDEGYRDFCLNTVRHLANQEEADSAAAAVRVLRLIGRPDPTVPLSELRKIVRQRLKIQTELLRLVAGEIAAQEKEIRQKPNPRRVSAEIRELHRKSQEVLAPALVSSERLPILGAFQYSLAGILFAQGGDPKPVLAELILWMKSEPEGLAPILSYVFFQRQGLIDLLDRHKWISGSFGVEPCSRFLLSASRGPEEADVLREFLERAFRALDVFPGLFKFILEQRFLQILKSWSLEGCKVLGLRPTVISLLSALLASENVYLRKTVDHLLRTDPQFTTRGSRMRALALDALNGRGREPVPTIPGQPRRLPAWLEKGKEESA